MVRRGKETSSFSPPHFFALFFAFFFLLCFESNLLFFLDSSARMSFFARSSSFFAAGGNNLSLSNSATHSINHSTTEQPNLSLYSIIQSTNGTEQFNATSESPCAEYFVFSWIDYILFVVALFLSIAGVSVNGFILKVRHNGQLSFVFMYKLQKFKKEE